MHTRLLRHLLTSCLVLLVVSCLDHGSPPLASTEPSPATTAAATAPAAGGPGAPDQASMPATLRMAFLRTQQKAAGYDFAADAAGTLRSRIGGPGARAEVAATPRGVRISGMDLGIVTASVGREGGAGSRAVRSRHAEGQELVLDREDGVEERYLAGPLGLEQSYLVGSAPEGQGPLAIDVAFDGLAPEPVQGASDRVLLRDDAGQVRGGYRDLVAADAEGRELPARMEVRGRGVALVIDDAGARYPLRVDPVVWTQQAELTAGDGASSSFFGRSVSVSGGIAIVGAAIGGTANQGSAYVFVQSGASWAQQAELTASDGAPPTGFGTSVSVSGGTALVGDPTHKVGTSTFQGAAYVFVQSGTTWVQQAELTAGDGAAFDHFGASVSLSGGTAVIGAYSHAFLQGAAYVFVQSGTTWAQQAELLSSDGAANDHFGQSVSVSGGTAVVGSPFHQVGTNASQGAAYVFVQSGTTWSQQAELTAADGAADDYFGQSVSVSGGTAVIGANQHAVGANAGQGAAYVFVQSGTSWAQQAELTAGDGAAGDSFGWSVSLSGGTAVVGANQHTFGANAQQGAAYVFFQSGSTWAQQAELAAGDGADGDSFGWSVSVSGSTAIVGSPNRVVGANVDQGAAYVWEGGANGAPCTSGTDCQSGNCVDAVCCDTACGGGVTTDCQACSVAAGASADGTCTSLTGTACDDGNGCTTGDACQAGVCTGSPVVCMASDECHVAGSCNPTSGMCSNPLQTDGTPCTGGTCKAGVCTPGGTGGAGGASASAGTGGATTSAGTGGAAATSTGATTSSGATATSAGTTTSVGAGGAAASTGSGAPGTSKQGGCSCRVAGEPAPGARWPLAAVVGIALGAARRRRRSCVAAAPRT